MSKPSFGPTVCFNPSFFHHLAPPLIALIIRPFVAVMGTPELEERGPQSELQPLSPALNQNPPRSVTACLRCRDQKVAPQVSSLHISMNLLILYRQLSLNVVVNVQHALDAGDSEPTACIPTLQIVGGGGCNASLSVCLKQSVEVVNTLLQRALEICIMMDTTYLIMVSRIEHKGPTPAPILIPTSQFLQATICLSTIFPVHRTARDATKLEVGLSLR